jgi:EAL domain-containing protein (putative c-di-GMP-specific phosphodiesterase class I)
VPAWPDVDPDHLARLYERARFGDHAIGLFVVAVTGDGPSGDEDPVGHARARLGELLRPTDVVVGTGPDEIAVLAPFDGPHRHDSAYEFGLAFARRLVVRPGSGAGCACVVGGVVHLPTPTPAPTPAPGSRPDDRPDPLEIVTESLANGRRLARAAGQRASRTLVVVDAPGVEPLGQALDQAIGRDQLRLHLQPVVELASGRRQGFEALLRWERPGHGLLAPDAFLATATSTDLIDPIGSWVIDHAVGTLARFTAEGTIDDDEEIGVNVVASQLRHGCFPDEVAGVLERHGVEPGRLVLEISEQSLLDDDPVTAEVLHRLDRLGTPLAIDDFGTGWSSLALLRRVPARVIKIDQGFIASLGGHPTDATSIRDGAIVRAILGLARDLGMVSVAEGIDQERQARWLREQGCDRGQGWLLGLPEPASRLRPR